MPIPREALHQAWELVCLNQFHDIIPGSSIHEVYVESQQQYAEIRAPGRGRPRRRAGSVIKARAGGDVVVVNPTSFRRDDLVFWPGTLPAEQQFAGAILPSPWTAARLSAG